MTNGVDELLLGDSVHMREVRRLVSRFAPTPFPVFISGPTGCGKGLVAEALHATSRRRGHYVVTNVAALGDGVVESELFGHVRGAFTNSSASRRGLVQHADRGTLFLDEIHRLSPTAQPKLLRVLETQLVRPVGSDVELRADFRLVSAANEDLELLVEAGRFQADLLARLSRLVIRVPPLIDHMEDLPRLAESFLHGLGEFGVKRLTQAGLETLMEYDWPRNVRELRSVIERAAVLADKPWIDRTDVIEAIGTGSVRGTNGVESARANDRHSVRPIPDPSARRERQLLDALKVGGGRVRDAAAILGVSINTVYRWMTEFGIATPERRRMPRRLRLVANERDGTR